MSSRTEEILIAMINGGDLSALESPQSRVEALLFRLAQKGGGGSLPIHICTSDEYDHLTGVPTVSSPDEGTLYLVPASSATTGNLFDEWIYADSTWERVGSANVEIPQSDWAQNDSTAADYIKNKPATIPAAQVQADWAQTDNTAVDYIKNKLEIDDSLSIQGAAADAAKVGELKSAFNQSEEWVELQAAIINGKRLYDNGSQNEDSGYNIYAYDVSTLSSIKCKFAGTQGTNNFNVYGFYNADSAENCGAANLIGSTSKYTNDTEFDVSIPTGAKFALFSLKTYYYAKKSTTVYSAKIPDSSISIGKLAPDMVEVVEEVSALKTDLTQVDNDVFEISDKPCEVEATIVSGKRLYDNGNQNEDGSYYIYAYDVSQLDSLTCKFAGTPGTSNFNVYGFYNADSVTNCSSSTLIGTTDKYINDTEFDVDVPTGAKYALFSLKTYYYALAEKHVKRIKQSTISPVASDADTISPNGSNATISIDDGVISVSGSTITFIGIRKEIKVPCNRDDEIFIRCTVESVTDIEGAETLQYISSTINDVPGGLSYFMEGHKGDHPEQEIPFTLLGKVKMESSATKIDVVINAYGTTSTSQGFAISDLVVLNLTDLFGEKTPDPFAVEALIKNKAHELSLGNPVIYDIPDLMNVVSDLLPNYGAFFKMDKAKFVASSAIDTTWPRWDTPQMGYGFKRGLAPIYNQVHGTIETDAMFSVIAKYGRWTQNVGGNHLYGGHVFEAWNSVETNRLTFIMGKNAENEACIIVFRPPNVDGVEQGSFGTVRIGGDESIYGFVFGRDEMTAYGDIIFANKNRSLVLVDANGVKHKLQVDTSGNLSTSVVSD